MDLSSVSSERLGDVMEAGLGVCYLATRFPKMFDFMPFLPQLHQVLSTSVRRFEAGVSVMTDFDFPNGKCNKSPPDRH